MHMHVNNPACLALDVLACDKCKGICMCTYIYIYIYIYTCKQPCMP